MRVLVAEDERVLAGLVATGLRRAGFAVDTVHDGEDALERLGLYAYDVLVLDRDLPRLHGDDVARRLVAGGSRTRILMLTAATAVEDRVEGLDLGADDYLGKPFEFPELVSRVRALRRRSARPLPPLLERDGLRMDTVRRTAVRDGRDLGLSPKEFSVLQILLEADGAVVSAEDLLERAWDAHADPFTGAVRVCMSKLRAKLGEPGMIRTVQGVGYVL
ncbi:DNA-binding response regulator [Streptomyces cinereoruber]|uniref:DNA-binding response regulator n=1 Tax=Streptomyces cinereoruber TaxID=67260 RepID=A0AAV4KKV6_9ACTN|nr:response regulator transcription factor [Streptomyces cinereoruber]MBB4159869.1 DNA-binding response OmpR family regulator [Streptomyces cinereoruber]MBY8817764.1 response regulator transcription factor [Streptomyces cinereoruber]NIH60577.1 DNA-binding response OmpR family regulator [Streptomyces cinereoruber]QEV33651.1 DNA-binding response regulator [Streptomyces cinereoruber]GGR32112.1 DNA-binding response regulator [Streptomyces cinereoruber]